MKNTKYVWIFGLTGTLALIMVPILLLVPGTARAVDAPWQGLPLRLPATDHTDLLPGPYETGPEVTEACLVCHADAAHEVMDTVHWTWESKPVEMAGRDEPITVGKKNSLNNFCIGIQSNWVGCTRCHAGYGWVDETFDFEAETSVDCLVPTSNIGRGTTFTVEIPVVKLAAKKQKA